MREFRHIHQSTLTNGMRIVTDRMETVETASIGVWVNAGARDENIEVNGISHMLEHMAFKGTLRRNAYAIAAEIEAVGGHLNAYTSRENTAYFAKVLKEDVPLAIDILSDILQNSVLNEAELERERAVILQEISQAHDTPDDIVFDHFQETAFPSQPLGRPVLGRPDIIAVMDRAQIMAYMRERYSAPRLVLAAAGNIEHDKIVTIAEDVFDSLPNHVNTSREAALYRGGDFRETRSLEQVHMVLGVEAMGYSDDDFYTASVLSTILGGGMSSRLFQEIREKRGLAYSISSFLSSYTDGGIFGVYAGTSEADAAELLPLILSEFDNIKASVGNDEVNHAKVQLKANLLMGLESTSNRCEQLAQQILIFDRLVPMDEVLEKIEAVNAVSVQKVANRILQGLPTIAAVGPIGNLPSYNEVEKLLMA
ncbi:MAG: peptidase M16 [Rhodospirillaceae bacterium TMED8]|nr:peptidase M16 [Magnetovibrio sp.]OUT52225.1 MAG: peptidase M16 [Rhodospirillaceae bacterium TMED8]|tara:strand:+ start:643 stop:1914 length:1272 start_codon:yes stop_codon:yes gene_type:complete